MTITRERATAAESTKMLKRALKKAFPSTKFNVRLSRGTAYGYASVRWTDGPTTSRVESVVAPFEGSYFDGSQDLEVRIESVLPDGRRSGLRGISCDRHLSPEFARRLADAVHAKWGAEKFPAAVITERGGSEGRSYWSVLNDGATLKSTGDYYSHLIWRASEDRSSVARSVGRDGVR